MQEKEVVFETTLYGDIFDKELIQKLDFDKNTFPNLDKLFFYDFQVTFNMACIYNKEKIIAFPIGDKAFIKADDYHERVLCTISAIKRI